MPGAAGGARQAVSPSENCPLPHIPRPAPPGVLALSVGAGLQLEPTPTLAPGFLPPSTRLSHHRCERPGISPIDPRVWEHSSISPSKGSLWPDQDLLHGQVHCGAQAASAGPWFPSLPPSGTVSQLPASCGC